MRVFVGPGCVKLGAERSQETKIAFVFAIYMLITSDKILECE